MVKKIFSKLPIPIIWTINILLFPFYYLVVAFIFGIIDGYFFNGSIFTEERESVWDLLTYILFGIVGLLSYLFHRSLYFKINSEQRKIFQGFLVVIGYVLLIDFISVFGYTIYELIFIDSFLVVLIDLTLSVFLFSVLYLFFKRKKNYRIILVIYLCIGIFAPFLHDSLYDYLEIEKPFRFFEISVESFLWIIYRIVAIIYLKKTPSPIEPVCRRP